MNKEEYCKVEAEELIGDYEINCYENQFITKILTGCSVRFYIDAEEDREYILYNGEDFDKEFIRSLIESSFNYGFNAHKKLYGAYGKNTTAIRGEKMKKEYAKLIVKSLERIHEKTN